MGRGPQTPFVRSIRSYRDVADPAAENVMAQVSAQTDRLRQRLALVGRVVVVASGKGGVGKSALTANLAAALSQLEQRVGAVDADLNGPSLARMLGVHGQRLELDGESVRPARGAAGIPLISSDLLMPDSAPLHWRNPASPEPSQSEAPAFLFQSVYEGAVLREFLADVAWGQLDFLLIDAPPGTDKLDRILQLLPDPPVLLLVGTPSEITRTVVVRSATAARQLPTAAIGLVVNMSGHVCGRCGHQEPLFDSFDPAALAQETGLEVWAEIPFDRRLATATDGGSPLVLEATDAPAARAIRGLANRLVRESAV